MFQYIPYELTFLQSLLSHRPDFLNPLFLAANHLDTGGFYLLAATLVYSGLGPRLGKPFILLLACCFASNYGLKHLFLQPRPLTLDPSLGLIKTHSLYGLPSGAAQAATAMAVFFNKHFKQRWVLWGSVLYVIFIGISRVYIGMHFISDVIAGTLIGFVLAEGFFKISTLAPIKLLKQPLWVLVSLVVIIGAATASLPYVYKASLGILCGVLWSHVAFEQKPYSPGWRPVLAIGFMLAAQQLTQSIKLPPSIFFSLYMFFLGLITHPWGHARRFKQTTA